MRIKPMAEWKSVRAFEAMLERWRRGEAMSWGDLFAGWVSVPVAPRSRETVQKVIQKVKWLR